MGDTRCGSPGTLQGLVSSDPSTTKHKPFPCTATNLPVTAHTSPMLRHPSHMHLVGQEQSLHACMRTRHIMSGLHTMRATTHTHTQEQCAGAKLHASVIHTTLSLLLLCRSFHYIATMMMNTTHHTTGAACVHQRRPCARHSPRGQGLCQGVPPTAHWCDLLNPDLLLPPFFLPPPRPPLPLHSPLVCSFLLLLLLISSSFSSSFFSSSSSHCWAPAQA
jgi:hypothetical protein